MARISGYNFHCNDVNGKFGTNQTAMGVPISDSTYTAAIPMQEGRTPYKKGDILLVKNSKNNTSALYHVTDVGGLPHADIDIAEGVGLDALGVRVTKGGLANGNGVSAVSQTTGFDVQKIGHAPFNYGDAKAAQKVQDVIAKVNKGDESMASLKNIPGFEKADAVKEEAFGQTLASYAPNVTPDVMNGGKQDYKYGSYNPDKKNSDDPNDPEVNYRPQDQYMAYIQRMMQEEPIFGFLMMLFGMLTGQFTQQDFANAPSTTEAGRVSANAIPAEAIGSGQANVEAAQGRDAKGQAAVDGSRKIAQEYPDAVKPLEQAKNARSFSEIIKGIFSGIPGLESSPVVDSNWHPPMLPNALPAKASPQK